MTTIKTTAKTSEINIPIRENLVLFGTLNLPPHIKSLVIFSHGSGSSRFSPRNRHVAEVLNHFGIATLLTDLLTVKEDETYQTRFNIELLTARLVAVTQHVMKLPELKDLPVGYFGASTGAASALKAAAVLKTSIKAVVSRGGRPDLAGDSLPSILAPTLLIVGGNDTDVIFLNKGAYGELTCEKEMKIVPGATHLFEEPGKLDEVADLAADWFNKYLEK